MGDDVVQFQRVVRTGEPFGAGSGAPQATLIERQPQLCQKGLDLPALLDRIEKEMPKAKPEVQWTMNNTLGAIGVHHAAHRRRAVAIGEKIGLYRDWPVSKGCIPPYVPVWVEAMANRA